MLQAAQDKDSAVVFDVVKVSEQIATHLHLFG
jgi:hypothetical protein